MNEQHKQPQQIGTLFGRPIVLAETPDAPKGGDLVFMSWDAWLKKKQAEVFAAGAIPAIVVEPPPKAI